ncbi:N-acylglucosamine 2-epimerase [Paenibacillus rhizosphaerae]|uniref:Cellobiose 2-epimerase n=1 Tax=Paenibacillus rhizosphaerae TaxID=297318 RepID=A0A1R1EJB6_9BACL|nr:AGE family epimerase/isomerase [Paenibacillus rhizosphaerae]OMF51905.1 N-acylglucosamine 2-epimerase [Paenibacillus rhizosphaerae]
MKSIEQEIRREWTEHILPFWAGLRDDRHGGYYGEVSVDLQTDTQAPKGGIATARQLWSFSAAYRVTGDEIWASHAKHAYSFLKDRLIDRDHGGMYWMVDHEGQPLDTRKHVYAQSFAVYSLSEYSRATGDAEALELARELFGLIEEKGYDTGIQAYKEEFDREWHERTNEMLSENGINADITMNTTIHVLEAYTTLYRAWPDPRVRSALENLLSMLYNRIYDPEKKRLNVFFDRSWNSLLDLTSFGHDIEASWLIDDAMKVIGSDHADYAKMVVDIAYQIADTAVSEDGSLMNEQDGDRIDDTRIWWVQAESMVGFYNAYQRTGDTRFLDMIDRMWTYTKTHIIDSRGGGEWYWSVQADGQPDRREIAGPWKCPYHNSRFCIEMIERMNEA